MRRGTQASGGLAASASAYWLSAADACSCVERTASTVRVLDDPACAASGDAQRIARQHDLAPLRENRLRAQCQLRLIPFLPAGLERDTRERRLAIGQRGPRLQLALCIRQRIPRVGACLRCAQLCGDRAQHGGELLPQHVALALPPERHLHEGRHADAQQDAHHPVADFSEVRGRAELLRATQARR